MITTVTAKGLLRLGWIIRAVVVLLYIGWVVIGFCVLRYQEVNPDHLKYIAVRDLPAGYRLRSDDFTFEPPIPMAKRRLLSTLAATSGTIQPKGIAPPTGIRERLSIRPTVFSQTPLRVP